MIPAMTARSRAARAWVLQRKRAARDLGCDADKVLDAKAEAIWAKYADPDYYSKEFAASAFRRKTEGPSLNTFKRGHTTRWDSLRHATE